MGPEIAQYGEGEVVSPGPGLQARNVVGENTQDLGVGGGEEVAKFLVRRQLPGSDRGESGWKER